MQEKPKTFQERIERILHDEDFRSHCQRIYDDPEFEFEKKYQFVKRIAVLDVPKCDLPDNAFHKDFGERELIDKTIRFYQAVDKFDPENPLAPVVEQNLKQYFTTDPKVGRLGKRAECGTVEKDGKRTKYIKVPLDPDIRTLKSGPHEACHSLSQSFLQDTRKKYSSSGEICPVIVDALFAEYLKQTDPSCVPMIKADEEFNKGFVIIKAREALLDACVIRVMTGQDTIQNVMDQYGHIFGENTINRCLDNIESINFSGMMEERYILPMLIGQKVAENFGEDPHGTIHSFKQALAHDHEYSPAQLIETLNLPPEEELVQGYINRMQNNDLAQ